MLHHNKGISPLIATVLLIGFTVALAAIIMTWGTDFIRGTTGKVDEQQEVAFLCTSQLDFQIQVDCANNQVFVDNRGQIDITALKLRFHKRSDGTVTVEDQPGISAFGKTPFPVANLNELSKVDAIATVKGKNGNDVICQNAAHEAVVNCQAAP